MSWISIYGQGHLEPLSKSSSTLIPGSYQCNPLWQAGGNVIREGGLYMSYQMGFKGWEDMGEGA